MAASPKSLVKKYAKSGPHTVLRGDLALAGQPGVVYTPAEGFNLPAVAFGHGWLAKPEHYAHLLEHLASWGIVAAAPATESGPVPSAQALAVDLGTTLDICLGVRLGTGRISVQPDRVGFVGHGFGAGAAVLAGARRSVAAVAALYPAPVSPPAPTAAASIDTPGLILVGEKDTRSVSSDAVALAEAWDGDVLTRTVDDASDLGLVEGRRLLGWMGFGGPERKTQRTTRALLAGFLRYHLAGDDDCAPFADPEVVFPGSTVVSDLTTVERDPGSVVARLLHG